MNKRIYLAGAIAVVFQLAWSSAEIRDFKLEAYFFQKVGEPFQLYVSEAVDGSGNLASGIVQVKVKAGDGYSPDSFPPILNPIVVANGTGSAFQVLTNVAPTILEGTVDTVRRSSNTIFVTSGELHHFSLDLPSPQTSGQPFSFPSRLIAKDRYGNPVVNFDAAVDSVIILASDSGVMSNNVFNTTQDFVLGEADVSAKKTTYTGRGGFVVFQAKSQSGITGLSSPILVRSLRIENVDASPGTVKREDTLTVTVQVFNTADIKGTVTDLDLDFSQGEINHYLVNATLPHTLSPNNSFDYSFKVPIPADYPAGTNQVSAKLSGLFNSFVIRDSSAGVDSFLVTGNLSLLYVSGSFKPRLVFEGSFPFSYTIQLSNPSSAYALLDTSTYLFIADTAFDHIRFNLKQQTVIQAGVDSAFLSFISRAKIIPPQLAAGKYPVKLVLRGYENGIYPYSDSVVLPDSLEIKSFRKLEYVSESLEPDTAASGRYSRFSFEVENSSDSAITIYLPSSVAIFELKSGATEYHLSARLVADSYFQSLEPGVHKLYLDSLFIPSNYPWSKYSFYLNLDHLPVPDFYISVGLNTYDSLYVAPPANAQRLVITPISSVEQFISPGSDKHLLTLALRNLDPNTSHSIALNGFSVSFAGASAKELFSGYTAEVTTRDWTINDFSVDGDKAPIQFPEPLLLAPNQEDTIIFIVDFKREIETKSFAVTLNPADFPARDYFQGQTGPPIPVTGPSGEVLSFQSQVYTLLSASFENSASVYPNPFNPDKEEANLIYNVVPASSVTLQIFTLTGERVKSFENPENINTFKWDGKNSDGKMVLSGVYLALLKVKNTGEEVKLRIGLVR